jgi:hypothetical protein
MPRDDWDDDEPLPRPRRRRRDLDFDDDDDFFDRGYQRERSGAVTSVAVVKFILGTLVLLTSCCGFVVVAAIAGEAGKQGIDIPGLAGGLVALFVLGVLAFVWGLAAIVTGIGIVSRGRWARILAMILGGMAAGGGLFFLFAAVAALTSPDNGGPMGDRLVGFAVCVLIGLILIGDCVWSFVILLNGRYAAEFHHKA